MGIIPDLLFLAAVVVGIVATLYSATVVVETFIRPRVAARRARRYGAKR